MPCNPAYLSGESREGDNLLCGGGGRISTLQNDLPPAAPCTLLKGATHGLLACNAGACLKHKQVRACIANAPQVPAIRPPGATPGTDNQIKGRKDPAGACFLLSAPCPALPCRDGKWLGSLLSRAGQQVGCGTSTLAADMIQQGGFESITALDWSEVRVLCALAGLRPSNTPSPCWSLACAWRKRFIVAAHLTSRQQCCPLVAKLTLPTCLHLVAVDRH